MTRCLASGSLYIGLALALQLPKWILRFLPVTIWLVLQVNLKPQLLGKCDSASVQVGSIEKWAGRCRYISGRGRHNALSRATWGRGSRARNNSRAGPASKSQICCTKIIYFDFHAAALPSLVGGRKWRLNSKAGYLQFMDLRSTSTWIFLEHVRITHNFQNCNVTISVAGVCEQDT